jgi:hypothetical protein
MLGNTFKMEHSWNNHPSNSTLSVWLFWKHPYTTLFAPIIYGIQNEKNQWNTYLLLHKYQYSLYISLDTIQKCIPIMVFVHHQFIMHGLLQHVYIILVTLILIPLWYFIFVKTHNTKMLDSVGVQGDCCEIYLFLLMLFM